MSLELLQVFINLKETMLHEVIVQLLKKLYQSRLFQTSPGATNTHVHHFIILIKCFGNKQFEHPSCYFVSAYYPYHQNVENTQNFMKNKIVNGSARAISDVNQGHDF